MPPGLLVSFEGIDGCGKSTQASLFFHSLRKKGIPAVLLKEPGGTRVGERIRKILLQPHQPLTAWCELFLYLASRAQLVEEVIRPAVAKGKIVILDRHSDSTLAYQGYGRELPLSFIRQAQRHFLGNLKPKLTFLLDASPAELQHILAA
ncbi:MAG: dTMP kinase, partial [Candidatus Omnitrophica bacterium]|nr:dTMP kinase [Candidatus Omnitrophota bacterium]